MSFNGSGTYNLPSPEYPAVSGTDILASDFNTIIENIAAALSITILRDGQASMLANLAMGGFKVTGSADGSADSDLATVGQMTTAVAAAVGSGSPVGAIVAWCGGYFSNGTNGAITSVLGNSIAAANAYLNASGWYVCDGAALNDADSPIFNGTGRYLPNLTDSRFLMGSTAGGTLGGINTDSHTHTVDITSFSSGSTTLSIDQIPPHAHTINLALMTRNDGSTGFYAYDGNLVQAPQTNQTGGGNSHLHTVDPPSTTSGTPSATENRPTFLSCLYIMKVK